MRRAAKVRIDLGALRHNLSIARNAAPRSKTMAVIKADAYGHGMIEAANALEAADGFAVASIGEGVALRTARVEKPVLVLQGAINAAQVDAAKAYSLALVLHNERQSEYFASCDASCPELWLKVDTGMGRLGLPPEGVKDMLARMGSHCAMLMSHFANADVPDSSENARQIERFMRIIAATGLPASMANSAALLALPEARLDWNRPGIMLYGASPVSGQTAESFGLRPVMTLTAPLIAVNPHKKGDTIGYGGDFICPEDMPVGIVAIGYGDGYPRHAPSGTPVRVNGIECPLVGRVSMDMLTVDLRLCPRAEPESEVILWGEGLPADRIAEKSGTIAYELFCSAGSGCHREYMRF